MVKVNQNYLKLPGSYLFSEVARRIAAHSAAEAERRRRERESRSIPAPKPSAAASAVSCGTAAVATAAAPNAAPVVLRKLRRVSPLRGLCAPDISPPPKIVSGYPLCMRREEFAAGLFSPQNGARPALDGTPDSPNSPCGMLVLIGYPLQPLRAALCGFASPTRNRS